MIVALAGLSLFACNKEIEQPENEVPTGETYSYTIAIDEGTKAYLAGDHIAWEEEDSYYSVIGWFATGINNSNYPQEVSGSASVDIDSTPRNFAINSYFPIEAGTYIYAYYRNSSDFFSDKVNHTYYADLGSKDAAPLNIPTTQSSDIRDAMPMVALPILVTSPINKYTYETIGTARFVNLGSVIRYNVFTTDPVYDTEFVRSVTFTATSPIAGDFNVDLTTVSEASVPAPSGLSENSVTSELDNPIEAGSSKADGLKIYQVVAPGTLSGTVTVTTDVATYSYPVSNIDFNRSSIKTLNVDLASANATRCTVADYEALLTAHSWTLVSVDNNGTDVTQNAGDLLTLNADHSLSVTCNTQADEVYDYINDTWVDYGLGETWDGVTREWSLWNFPGVFPTIGFSTYAYPLAIVADCINSYLDYSIVSLTDSELVLQYGPYTITFSDGSVPAPTPEALLTAHEWELVSVLRMYTGYETEYSDVTQTAGNKITFNADHSFTFDCTANGGKVYDYYNGGYETDPYFSPYTTYEWSISETGGTNFLDFTAFAYPLVIVDDEMNPQSFEIALLTDSCLELHHSDGNRDYIITFTTPGEKSHVEDLLTAHDWELSTVTRDGVDVTRTDGNRMTLNANHSISIDCTTNNEYYGSGMAWNYIWDAYSDPTDYSWSTWKWSVSFGTVTSLVFSVGSFPLVIVGDTNNSALPYEIVTLTDSALVLEYNNTTCGGDSVHGLYAITFTAIP